jgi:hypothetical protein
MKNDFEEALAKIPGTVSSQDVLQVFSQIMNYKTECEVTKRETAKYEAVSKVMMKEIDKKYNLYENIFTEIFTERRAAILKHFEVIDKGIKEGDRELINMGLMFLSNIVVSSPFGDAEKLHKMLESGQTISIESLIN